jgi:hypothetical protein
MTVVVIRIWQSGQRGRWAGSSSGSGFVILGMAKKYGYFINAVCPMPDQNPKKPRRFQFTRDSFGGNCGTV